MADAPQPDMDILTRAISNITRYLTVAAQEIAHFVNSPTVAGGNQILHQLATLQAPLARLAAVVNANDIIAQNSHNAILESINSHISTVLAAITNAVAALTNL